MGMEATDKVGFLRSLAKAWFGNSQQHSIHAQLLRQRGYGKLADKIEAESDEEWAEAKKVNARLIELGETPVVEIETFPVITDVKEMLQFDYDDAKDGPEMMSKALALFDDDYITKRMLEEFLVDEQEHLNWVRQHLGLIEDIGLDNYLIEQLG